MDIEYEYGIGRKYSAEGMFYPHIDDMRREEAEEWISYWEGDPSTFFIIRRPISKWEVVE